MESNLVQQVKSYFSEEVISSLSAHVGEDRERVKSGIDASIPSLLLGFQNHSREGLDSMLNQAKHLFSRFGVDNVFGNFFGSDQSSDNTQFESNNLLGSIFGDKLQSTVTAIANFIGIKADSIKSILGAALPAVISAITNKGSNWDAGSISQLLSSHKNEIAAALPAGLGLGAFGSSFAQAEQPVEIEIPKTAPPVQHIDPKPPVVHTEETVRERKGGGGIWWLLIPLILLLLWFFFGKKCSSDATVNDKDTTTMLTPGVDTSTSMLVDTVTVNRDFIDIRLPDGSKVKAYPSGIEDKLLHFLESADYKSMTDEQLKDTWFDFDNLNFKIGTAEILPESQQQLENLAAILALFPDAKVKIGGYTDKTGDEAINKKVSQERADAVKNYLASKGLSAQVIGAEGYGSEFAKAASNAPEQERVKDRKVSVSVRK